jgi:iron complex outermembrane receptor protein
VDLRVYFKRFDRAHLKLGDNNTGASIPPHDDWNQIRTGFRMHTKLFASGEFTLQGDLYDGRADASVAGTVDNFKLGRGNVLGRYTHTFSDTHNASIQFYYDRTTTELRPNYDRTDRKSDILIYELDTLDLEITHQIAPLPWLDLVWGVEYRHQADASKTANPTTFIKVDALTLLDVL